MLTVRTPDLTGDAQATQRGLVAQTRTLYENPNKKEILVSEKPNPDDRSADETPAEQSSEPEAAPADESAEAGTPDPGPAAAPEADPPTAVASSAIPTQAAAAPATRSAWLRGKAGLIGAGLALALVAGASGFALAEVTDDRGDHRGDHRGDERADHWGDHGSFPDKGPRGHGGGAWMDGHGERGQPPGLSPDQRPDFDRQFPDSSDGDSGGATDSPSRP